MPPLILGILLLVYVVSRIVYSIRLKRYKAKILGYYRTAWGRPRIPALPEDLAKIRVYDRLKTDDAAKLIDEKTWLDLNLDKIFELIDRTSSRVGQQFLYHVLRTPHFQEEPLLQFERIVNCFKNANLRESLQIKLHLLSHKDAFYLPYLFLDELPQLSSRRFLFLVLGVAPLIILLAAWFNPIFWIFLFLSVATNMVLSLYYRRRLEFFIPPLRLLNQLINISKQVGDEYGYSEISEQAKNIKAKVDNLSGLQRKTAWLMVEIESDNPLSMLYSYLNVVLLLDVNCFAFAVEELRQRREDVAAIYEGLGYLDAAISVASLRHFYVNFCTTPVFLERRKAYRFKQVFHPLLASPIPNDLAVNAKGILLTGSNMSGKSTFIRTVGVNTVLAQTIHTCFAQAYEAPFLNVKACMGAADSLMDSKSHYLAEVECIRVLVESTPGRQCLFLIDELFRGTNTIERVAAAKAILEYLNRGEHLVMVATHDIELAELLDRQYESHHFREIIQDGQMTFDYQLQEGTSSTRNAIAILELFGYPKPIVADALEVVDRLAQDKSGKKRSSSLLSWLGLDPR